MTYTLCYLISHKWYSRVSPLSLLEKHLDAHFVLFGTTESLRCQQWMAHVVLTLVLDPWDSEDKAYRGSMKPRGGKHELLPHE